MNCNGWTTQGMRALLCSLAIDVNGDVWTWGYNFIGQLGDGSTTPRNTPAKVPGLNLN